jgi:hypothetical protein
MPGVIPDVDIGAHSPHLVTEGFMKKTLLSSIVALALVGLWASSCSDEPPPETPPPSVCTEATCPAGWCTLRIEFSENCADRVPAAEVLLDGSLEPESASFGTVFTSTGHVPVSEVGEFFVRSERWEWHCMESGGLCTPGGPLAFRCENPETDGRFTLQCADVSPDEEGP